jgi:hypothetical protein
MDSKRSSAARSPPCLLTQENEERDNGGTPQQKEESMHKRDFTIGITLVLLLAGGLGKAEAKKPNFIEDYAGSSVDGVIDTNGDGRTASVVTAIAKTTLGRVFAQGAVEFLPALATNVSCPTGTVEFPQLQNHAVLTLQATGEQLFQTYTSGTACLDPTTLTVTYHGQGNFTGGTGRFVHATGPLENTGTQTFLVLDPAGHSFGASTGTVTGTLSGVGDGGD